MASRRFCGLLAVLAVLAGCTAIRPLDPIGDAGAGHDTGGGTIDVGATVDAFTTDDAFSPPIDAFTTDDAFVPPIDAATDAGTDAATPLDAYRAPDAAGDANCTVYYMDGDGDGYGTDASATMSCAGSPGAGWRIRGGDCNDANPNVRPGARERCNGIDDDCNGLIDDGIGMCATGCTIGTYGVHTYQFCNAAETQSAAATQCTGMGYHLADLNDAGEDAFVHTTLMTLGITGGFGLNSGVWIGMTETATPPYTFAWSDGSTPTYFDWDLPNGEPNHNGTCVRMRSTGLWADTTCTTPFPFVCETP